MRKNNLFFYIKYLLPFFFGSFFCFFAKGQFTATWGLTSNGSSINAGVQATNITTGDFVPGISTVGGALTTNGYPCTAATNTLPASATDGYHLDFPIRSNAGYAITITDITFTANIQNGGGSVLFQAAYRTNGTGSWITLMTSPTTTAGTKNIVFNGINSTLSCAGFDTVRLYIYGGTTTSKRDISIKNFVITGNTTACGPPPTVQTTSAAATGRFSGVANGDVVVSNGTNTSGICWSTLANPTIALATKTTNGPTFGTFSHPISGLLPNTLYHVRAYATNAVATVYGNDLTFITDPPVTPTITTIAPSSVTMFTANSGGNIADDGGAPVTIRGVCWSTSPNPTTANTTTNDGTGTGSYPSTLAGLQPSTTYYVRAYAINSAGTAYGNEYSFTTPPPTPTLITNVNTLNFGTDTVNNCSTPLSFTISGVYLNPADSLVTITAPFGFRVSTSAGGPFYPYIQIPYNGSTLANTTIYIRFCPTQVRSYNDSIKSNTLGALTNYIRVIGTGVDDPTTLQTTSGFSNRGKEFWTGYGASEKMYVDNSQDLRFTFYNGNNAPATVTLSMPNHPTFAPIVYTVPANSAITTNASDFPESGTDDARLPNEGVYNTGIKITSDTPIVVYCHAITDAVYAASILFPTPTLGKEYTSLNFNQRSDNANTKSYLFIVATQDNTMIEVTLPSGVATDTHAAGSTFTQLLNTGEVLNLFGKAIGRPNLYTGNDLSGTVVKSISSNGSCKPFAMFSGSSKITIDCDNGSSGSGDNLFQQMFPKQAWGTKVIAIPTLPLTHNFYRILVGDPSTVVTRNGIPLTGLINNKYYEYFNSTASVDVLEGDKPIMVAQYMTTHGECNNLSAVGDPDMTYISSLQQTIDTVSFVSSPLGRVNNRAHYLNVAIPASGVASFKLDGVLKSTSFIPVPSDPTIYYAQFTGLTQTFHTITSAVGFNATAYGVADAESYAYNAGTNLKALIPQYLLQNQYGTGPSPVACRNNEFFLYATLKYKPTKLEWYFFNNPNLNPNNNYTQLNPVASDSFYVDNQKYYVYKNPLTFLYNTIGTFNFQVIATLPIPDGCDDKQVLNYSVNVIEKPTAYFTYPTPLSCNQNSLIFTDSSYANGLTLDLWNWSFGDPSSGINNTTIQENPQHLFTSVGSYPVRLHITTLEGCYDDTTINVLFNPRPAIFNLSSLPVCYNPNAQTTSLSYDSVSGSPILYSIVWDSTPSNHFQNISYSSLPASPITINVPDSTYPGTYTGYIRVKDANGCESDSVPFSIKINGLPQFTLTEHNPSCAGICDGSIDVHLISGTPPYHFTMTSDSLPSGISWTSNSDTIIKNLCAGTYQVSVTDSNGCASTQKHSPIHNQNTPCIKIESILTDAFSEIESDEELIFFSTGKSTINTKDIAVNWPTKNKWLGICENKEYVVNANKTIKSGGKLIPIQSDESIPPYSKVVLVSSNNLKKNNIDFSSLNYDLFIIFQCGRTNIETDYLNDNTSVTTTIELSISAGEECYDSVKYEPAKLKKNK